MSKEEKKNMQIANCRICLLNKSNCADCPLSFALKLIEAENHEIEMIESEKWLKLQPKQQKAKQIQEWLDAGLKITLQGELSC